MKNKNRIQHIVATDTKMTSRAGLSLFLRYVDNTGVLEQMTALVSSKVKFGGKGLKVKSFFRQMLAHIMDGSDPSISSFKMKKNDIGYASTLEVDVASLASPQQVTRKMSQLIPINDQTWSSLLNDIFISRLLTERPKFVVIGVDTMVLDNNDSLRKEGCERTYKDVRGFKPLQFTWGPYFIGARFRSGDKHCNHGTDYIDMARLIVRLIRDRYSKEVPILFRADAGFFDGSAFDAFDGLGVHFITTGKQSADVMEHIDTIPKAAFEKLKTDKRTWDAVSFGTKCKCWSSLRRAIFTRLVHDDKGQYQLNLDNQNAQLIYTNIGTNKAADTLLRAVVGDKAFEPEFIVNLMHQRGSDELNHRSLKELATTERLPFRSMGMNRAYYFMLVITHCLFETFKHDVSYDKVSKTVYPNTFRRLLIDIAGTVVHSGRQVKLKLPMAVCNKLSLLVLWERCNTPPKLMAA